MNLPDDVLIKIYYFKHQLDFKDVLNDFFLKILVLVLKTCVIYQKKIIYYINVLIL